MTGKRANKKESGRRSSENNFAGSKHPLTVSREELLVDGSDDEFRRLVNMLFPLLTLHTEIRNSYASMIGLNGASYTILLCIRTLGDAGPVSMRDIVDQLRLSGSFITAEANLLEQKGLVKKRRSEKDKRVVFITLTPKATDLLDSIASLRRQVNDVQFGSLNRTEFKQLILIVERLIASSESALELLRFLKRRESPSPVIEFTASKR